MLKDSVKGTGPQDAGFFLSGANWLYCGNTVCCSDYSVTTPSQLDKDFMQQALRLADNAEAAGEVPVGALVVLNGEVIGRGYNQVIQLSDPSAHAEMQALRDAANSVSNYRLLDTTLYVTLEPCPMCAGALVHSRVRRVVFGAWDQKAGACGSVINLAGHPQLNHQFEVTGGVLADECAERLSFFFRQRRAAKKKLRDAAREYEKKNSTDG